jgi:uncharacterized surface protein with fasciclin (FAS1) repeats
MPRHVVPPAAAAAAALTLLVLLLASHAAAAPAATAPATSAQTPSSRGYTIIPDMDPYPRLGPYDDGYPGNLPANLPSALPEAPPVLVEGAQTECAPDTTVEAVLRSHGRTGMISLLKASPIGAQVLSGRAMATVLAPPNEAVAALKLSPADVNRNPLLATTFSNYHVIQGLRPLGVMAADPLRNWNTTLSDAYCPTAYQTVSSLTRATAAGGALDSAAAAAQDEVYLRSGVSTARVVKADVVACNSVVHFVDRVLDPCCRSLWEQLPSLSVVTLTPSYFDGFKAPPPPGNDDASNRRIFEEQLLDSLLYMTYRNSTRTVLWPAPSAWDGFSLSRALGPSVPLDSLAARTRALKMLALYGLSYGQLLLPKDYGVDARADPELAAAMAQAPTLPFVSALHNVTRAGVWKCKGSLSLVAGKAAATGTQQAGIDVSQANTGRPARDGKPVAALTTLAPTAAAGAGGVVAAPKRAPASPRVLPAQGPIDERAAAAMAAAGGAEEQPQMWSGFEEEAPAPVAAATPQPRSSASPPSAAPRPQPAPAPAAKPPQQQSWPRQQPATTTNIFLVDDPEQIGEEEEQAAAAAPSQEDYGTGEEEQQQQQAAPAPARAPAPAPTRAPAPAPAPAPTPVAPAPAPAAPPAAALVASEPLAAASAASAVPAPIPTLLVEGGNSAPQQPAAEGEGDGGTGARRRHRNSRRRLAQAGTQELTIVGTYETCEGIRILLVDSVPVPCDFPELVRAAKTVEAQMDAFALPVRQTVESYYTDLRGAAGAIGGRVVGAGAWRVAATLGLGGAVAAALLL